MRGIGAYGLLGDTRAAALVSPDGSIDWLCLPRFDGEPVFGALVDPGSGGRFVLGVADATIERRRYRPGTTTIQTEYRARDGLVTVCDTMVADTSGSLLPQLLLVRTATCTRGTATMRLLFDPRVGLPGRAMRCARRAGALIAERGRFALSLHTSPDLAVVPGVWSRATLREGDRLVVVLGAADRQPVVVVPPGVATEAAEATDRWWREWTRATVYDGSHREQVERSLVTLRLLTYAPSGAPVAAPTTSIPAPPGTARSWDYRYSWPRDASLGLQAFLALRGAEEPAAFLRWLTVATRTTQPRIPVLTTLDGRPAGRERVVRGVGGFARAPVRIGNAAAGQHQLDVYGWVLEAVAAMAADSGLERGTARAARAFARFVARRWRDPDSGIWERRGPPRHHVHSKMMAFVALDRAAMLFGSARERAGWLRARDEIAREVRRHGFDDRLVAYVGAYGSPALDAAVLLSVCELEEPASPRTRGTIDAVRSALAAGGPLLYRYDPASDGLPGTDAAFVACSFWLAAALAKSGRAAEAAGVFEDTCRLATPLDLFAEQIDPSTGEHVGNFPQALSHASLLIAAATLNEATASRRGSPRTRGAPRSRRPASRVRS